MTKEFFTKLINDYTEWNVYLDKLEDFGIFLDIDSILLNYPNIIFEDALKLVFVPEGVDLILWWLFEKKPGIVSMWDENDKEIPMETIDDLWNEIQHYTL